MVVHDEVRHRSDDEESKFLHLGEEDNGNHDLVDAVDLDVVVPCRQRLEDVLQVVALLLDFDADCSDL